MQLEQSPFIVLTTYPNLEQAKQAAQYLVLNKLAACVNILPNVTSVYMWEGKLNEGDELQLVIKTQKSCLAEIEAWIQANHPYELAECVFVPLEGGSSAYLEWLFRCTSVG